MTYPPDLHYLTQITLDHAGDCALMGAADGVIYTEEYYGEDGWVAQHAVRLDGSRRASVDEDHGNCADFQPLELPANAITPRPVWAAMGLNFAGARHRGLREPERITEVARPLAVAEKMALAESLKLSIMPPLLIGITESYVLAEAMFTPLNIYVVCRRMRLAYALPAARIDNGGLPYDYDTLPIYAAHLYLPDDEPPLVSAVGAFAGVRLHRPMDCLIAGEHLYIADGGADDRLSAIHVWRIAHVEPILSPEEQLRKKLYG